LSKPGRGQGPNLASDPEESLVAILTPETHTVYSYGIGDYRLTRNAFGSVIRADVGAIAVIGYEGSASFRNDDGTHDLSCADLVLLKRGSSVQLRAGPQGFSGFLVVAPGEMLRKVLHERSEIYSPARNVRLIEDESGPDYWQPEPTLGYVTPKVTPETSGVLPVSIAFQRLEPGGRVRRHHHRFNEETLLVVRGQGLVGVNETQMRVSPGGVAFFPPFADHFLVADMAVPLDFFAIISPPGIEQPLISYGRLRAGENAAPVFPRTAGMADEARRAGFVLKEISKSEW